jgi:hypothetical protein
LSDQVIAIGWWLGLRIDLTTRKEFMSTHKENYIIDEHGERISVVLDIADYRKLLAELEELEAIRAYDAAKASGDEAVSFEKAVSEIEQER